MRNWFSIRAIQFVIGLCAVAGAGEKEYISQTYIDTTVARALYLLTAASDQAEMGLTMESAVDQAKLIAKRLRAVAKTDANQQYILFKVQELESQIYLEEQGIYQTKIADRQRSANQLVHLFNVELARSRPDFAQLKTLAEKTSTYDDKTFGEMSRSYEQRKRGIAAEILESIRRAIEDDAYDLARSELAYCRQNRAYLGIGLTEYARLEGKLQARVSTDGELAFIDRTHDHIDSLLATTSLGDSRGNIALLFRRLSLLEGRIPKKQWDRRYFRTKRQENALELKEDALMNRAREILATDGVFAAGEYLEKKIKPAGVDPAKIATLNEQITSTALAHRDEDRGELGEDLALLTSYDEDTPDDFLSDLRSAAKQKASAGPFPERKGERVSRMEQLRRRNLRVAQENAEQREERLLESQRERAQREVMLIYALLEQGEIAEAFEQFDFVMKNLKQYLSAEDIESLDTSVKGQSN